MKPTTPSVRCQAVHYELWFENLSLPPINSPHGCTTWSLEYKVDRFDNYFLNSELTMYLIQGLTSSTSSLAAGGVYDAWRRVRCCGFAAVPAAP